MTFKKALGLLLLVSCGTLASLPIPAFAKGAEPWEPKDIIDNAYNKAGTDYTYNKNFDGATISGWVTTFTTWALGIAIAIFVLKLVLTAIDKWIFKDNSSHPLRDIPFVGAYKDDNVTDILKNFAQHLAIVLGAWVFVQLVVNVVMFIFDALAKQ